MISKLDNGNATKFGLPGHLCETKQSMPDAAAQSVFHLRRHDHVTRALIDFTPASRGSKSRLELIDVCMNFRHNIS